MDKHQAFAQDVIEHEGIEYARQQANMPARFDKFNKTRCIGCRRNVAQGETFYHQRGMMPTCEKCHEALVAAVA